MQYGLVRMVTLVKGTPAMNFYKGTRRMKLLDSNEIRQLRDVCVFEINGMEVFM